MKKKKKKKAWKRAGDFMQTWIDVMPLKRFQGWGVFPTTTTNPKRPLKDLQRLRGWAGRFSHVAREKKALEGSFRGHRSTFWLTYGTLACDRLSFLQLDPIFVPERTAFPIFRKRPPFGNPSRVQMSHEGFQSNGDNFVSLFLSSLFFA